MKKINIAVLGTIGVGKTTLLNKLYSRLREETDSVIMEPEPSVTIPFINDVLKKFYNDNANWSFPLQLCISAAQESYMQTLRESDYDYSLFDAPYSSDIYGYSHAKHRRMKQDDFYALCAIGRPFKFDVVIVLTDSKEETIKRIKNRNKRVEEGDMDPDKKDVTVDDFSYLDKHIEDFSEYMPIYLNKFKAFNKNVRIININHIPDLNSKEYDNLIEEIWRRINE